MAVIRAAQAEAALQRAVVLDLSDLRRQAEELKSQARREADQILAEARRKADRLIEAASHEGFERGRRDGFETGRNEGAEQGRAEAFRERKGQLESLQTNWESALDEFNARRQAMLLDAQANLLRLAVTIAERFIHRAVALDPECISRRLSEALKLVNDDSAVRIRLNPRDLDQAQNAMPRILERLGRDRDVRMETDDSIIPGGFILRSGDTEIDARLEMHLERITASVLPPPAEPATSPPRAEVTNDGSPGEGPA